MSGAIGIKECGATNEIGGLRMGDAASRGYVAEDSRRVGCGGGLQPTFGHEAADFTKAVRGHGNVIVSRIGR